MRGKAHGCHLFPPLFRITPAYAGKSTSSRFRTAAESGSPPPMRGKVRGAILPECHSWDHPRLCGEKLPVLVYPLHVQGSPPPMRGKVLKKDGREREIRITPAYAGKSCPHPRRRRMRKDHPRLCGEKLPEPPFSQVQTGSPPPMRGKVYFENKYRHVKRITPAYAGKSFSVKICLFGNKDHPRLCGEKGKK